ncbi:hypothetical protein F5H01DRAFT_393742 [Linnemannia elongata]|nr:hypothetical protein F5H01DRAFT_393742 [Linnemannia elongata]
MTTGHWSPLQARISCLFLLFVSLFVSWCCVCFVHNRTKKKWAEVRNEGARRGEVMDEGWIESDREKLSRRFISEVKEEKNEKKKKIIENIIVQGLLRPQHQHQNQQRQEMQKDCRRSGPATGRAEGKGSDKGER